MASPASLSLRVSPSKFLHVSPELLDPKLNWSLEDLKEELDALSSKFKVTPTPEPIPSPPSVASYSFSWRELSVAADFGRSGRPFKICAFDDESDSEEDDGSNAQSKERRDDGSPSQCKVVHTNDSTESRSHGKDDSPEQGVFHAAEMDKKPWLLSRSETSEGLVLELEHERLQRIQEEVRQRWSSLDMLIEEESIKATANIEQVVREQELRKEMAHRIDQQYQRSIAEVRDSHLSALQRKHEQHSLVEERKIRQAAEARRREVLAREERERQERLKAEAEAKRKADAILATESERKKKAEAAAAAALQRERLAKAAQEQSALEQVKQETANSSALTEARRATEPKPVVSKAAADLEHMRHMKLREMLQASGSLQMNAPLKKVLKEQEKNLTKLLQQVSATQEQVRMKSINLMKELAPSPQQPFNITTFASKLMSQCEIQVSKLPSFAFALAQVVVNISSHVPEVMEVVLATLNQVCIFTVPKYYIFKKSQFENDRDYFKVCGYKEEDGKLESTDEYAARMTAYVTLYAAIMQAETEGSASPNSLKEGWAWCARLLNSLPPNRLTASALEAFLKVAGFKLCQVYNRSFMRMLNTISTDFLTALKQRDDADSRAVVSRLETYIGTRQYLKEPEGLRMPRTDLSSTLKC